MKAEPRWVNSAGKRSIQLLGICHRGESHSAVFDPTTMKVTCFSECGGGMLFHTWVKRVLNLDNPQDAKDFIEDWIDGRNIDFNARVPRDIGNFEYKERPFEPQKLVPVEGIPSEIIDSLYSKFDSRLDTLKRLLWSKEDGIDPEILKLYQVAYYPKRDTIILPHHNINGEIVGLYERSFWPLRKEIKKRYPDMEYQELVKFPRAKYVPLVKEPEYLTEDEKKTSWSFPNSLNLYGLHLAKDAIRQTKKAIIFEGGKSVMLAHQYGIEYTVATHTFGAHVNHISMLIEQGAEEIYLAFDKQYQTTDSDDIQWQLYDKRTRGLAEKVGKFVDVYRIRDFEEENKQVLAYKDAPIDKGEQIFRMLLDNREPLVVGGKSTAKIEAEKRNFYWAEGLEKLGEKVRADREAKKQLQLFPPQSDDLKTSAAPLTFRGKPIVWDVSQEMKTIITPCAFDEGIEEQRPGRKKNYILYDGNQYTKEGFYKAMF